MYNIIRVWWSASLKEGRLVLVSIVIYILYLIYIGISIYEIYYFVRNIEKLDR